MEKITLMNYVTPQIKCVHLGTQGFLAQSQPMDDCSSGEYSNAAQEEEWW